MYNQLAEEYRWMNTGAWAMPKPEDCPCHGSGWCLSDLDTWHRCPVHVGGLHPDEWEVYMDALEWWEEEKKKPVLKAHPRHIGGEPSNRPGPWHKDNPDDVPF